MTFEQFLKIADLPYNEEYVAIWNGAIDAAIEIVDGTSVQRRLETVLEGQTRLRSAHLAALRQTRERNREQ